MKALIISSILACTIVATVAVSAKAAPVGSAEWWQEMDREGRGGRPS
jgi:hypothetical protein